MLVDMTSTEWDEVIETNLRGVFLSNQKALAVMIPQRRGTIINISSTSGREGHAYDSAYCASKFGVLGLTESVAQEVQQYNIRVMSVLPDAVNTSLWANNGPIAPPPGALPPERIADLLLYMLTLPEDTVMVNPVIAPFRPRKRKASP
jgi:NAD(P)-dependent dehydrogenase (short-subunit alcohol dehydrogenase family)